MKKYLIILLTYFMSIQIGNTATFCVTTSAELNAAMLTASVNSQDNHIKIETGTYVVESGFLRGTYTYIATESFDLEISGGWSEFFNEPCGQNLGGSPFLTILDGGELFRIMHVEPGVNADVTISGLYFANGKAIEVIEKGAGLDLIIPDGATGDILIERNAFINNHAWAIGALRIEGGSKVDIKNNLFLLNTSDSGFSVVNIAQNNDNGYGVYFINNTVILNSGGAYFNVRGPSQAMIVNNIFWDNVEADLGLIGNGYKYLKNNNIGIQSYIGNSSQTHADVRSGNISSETLFESGLFNFTPSVNSELVSHGIKTGPIIPVPITFQYDWNIGTLDFSGNTRNQGSQVDIGAYESSHESWIETPIFKDGFD